MEFPWVHPSNYYYHKIMSCQLTLDFLIVTSLHILTHARMLDTRLSFPFPLPLLRAWTRGYLTPCPYYSTNYSSTAIGTEAVAEPVCKFVPDLNFKTVSITISFLSTAEAATMPEPQRGNSQVGAIVGATVVVCLILPVIAFVSVFLYCKLKRHPHSEYEYEQ